MSRTSRSLRRVTAACAAAAATAVALAFVAPADAAQHPSPDTPHSAVSLPEQTRTAARFTPGGYVVQLRDPAAAAYTGGIAGLPATHPSDGGQLKASDPDVEKYAAHLANAQQSVARAVGATVEYRYTLAFNGFSADLTAAQAAELAARDDVAAVVPDELLKLQDAEPDYEFLGLQNGVIGSGDDSGLWAALGGPGKAGAGVVIGDIDTGISPESPSFAGTALKTGNGTVPALTGGADANGNPQTVYRKADGGTFTGVCQVNADPAVDSAGYDPQTGETTSGTEPSDGSWTAADCSSKIISARYFDAGEPRSLHGDRPTEYESPRDADGHGSHTASTAAGDYGVDASITVGDTTRDFGGISGMAPAAKLAVYKACWQGPYTDLDSDDGCVTADILAAINQAVADGVDVLNYSIAGTGATTTYSVIDQAFLGAAAAGVVVAAAAGNLGSDASTVDNAAPWYTTVAASTIPSYRATAVLGDGTRVPGASVTVPAAGVSAGLVDADAAAADGMQGYSATCQAYTLDPAAVTGRIVLCDRGDNTLADKAAEVQRAGGVGMLLVNTPATSDSLDDEQYPIPVVAVAAQYRDRLHAYAGTAGATVAFVDRDLTGAAADAVPQLAAFSGRGPVTADGGDVLKPDLAAPGVAILAASASKPAGDGFTPSFEFMDGTSMATPHIAGLAALYLGRHPTASAAEVKSAMMTSAYDTVDAAGHVVDDPFAQGAGQVDPARMLEPGLVYDSGVADWQRYLGDVGLGGSGSAGVDWREASDLNLPSIQIGQFTSTQTVTRTVRSTQAGTYTPRVSLPGFAVTVSFGHVSKGVSAKQGRITFTKAGQRATMSVRIARTTAAISSWTTGALDLVGSGRAAGIRVHSPIAVRPVDVIAPATVSATGTSSPKSGLDVAVVNGAGGAPAVTTLGLAAHTLLPDNGSAADPAHSGGLDAGDFDRYWQDHFVEVPDAAALAKFEEHAVPTSGVDFDLIVFKVDLLPGVTTPTSLADVNATEEWDSWSPGADEEIDLTDPQAGWYDVVVWAASGSGDFDLYSTVLSPSGGKGAFTAALRGPKQAGAADTLELRWSGLAPNTSYLGLVQYGSHGQQTVVTIDSGPGSSTPGPGTRPTPHRPSG
ncbi:S8 family serine peptidase [Gryllotalpicola ginsengisoli]|uniref:S8 family serine peptidase n=1 Tax=Gryllotalpicola ginsengisoli TaxID=444608 RepID=UPI0003B39246|nr:S8 family serine peptidase [Gryllotalpicola ginsengisoli]